MKAINYLQDKKECWVCGATQNLQKHHIYGGRNRRVSEQANLTVWLCRTHHTGAKGVHFNQAGDLILKQACQEAYEEDHGHQAFMDLIGRNYL